jgi:hypothetical protein
MSHATASFNARADKSAGWDEGVLNVDGGMTLGEKATLTITGYVARFELTNVAMYGC